MNEDIVEARYMDDSDLSVLFAEMREGYKVQLLRKEPLWAKGYLAQIDVDPQEPISMEWIREQWGGKTIVVKVLDENSKYVGAKTVYFPEPPRKDGLEIVQGPTGPVPVNHPQAQNLVSKPVETVNAGGRDNTFEMMKLFMDQQARQMEQQATQSQMMNQMLLTRVSDLESLLAKKMSEQPQPVQYGPYPDQHAQIRQTLETIKLMDELRNAVSREVDDDRDNGLEVYQPLIDKIIERLTDDHSGKAKPHDGAPVLPPPRASQGGDMSDEQILSEAQNLFARLSPEKREMLADQLFGEDEYLEEEQETPHIQQKDHRQEIQENLNSLLSDEDRELLESEDLGSSIPNTSDAGDYERGKGQSL